MWWKQTDGIVWIKIAFTEWMHIICFIYQFLEAPLFWDLSASFWFFLLIINRESHGVVFLCHIRIDKWGDYKINFTDKLNLAKTHRLKGLTYSPYNIVSYLHFHPDILTPQTFVIAEAGFDLTGLMFVICLPCFLPARFTHMCASLRNQNKCKPSIVFPLK